MNLFRPEKTDPALLDQLNQILEQISTGRVVQSLPKELPLFVDPAQNQLSKNILLLARQYNESFGFMQDLARGKLDTAPPIRNYFSNPFKSLHSELLHLTWQIQQIAKGDYEQKVSFSGDFSHAINSMIQILQQKEDLDKINRENEIKLQKYADELAYLNNKLMELAITDALTGAFNRRYFQERLESEIARAQRREGSLALVMLDIDHFKQVNDRFGHAAGDQVLTLFCQRLSQRLRRIDVLCRLGGEEFIVLCPDTDQVQAMAVATALWQALRSEPVDGVGLVTASFGVAAWELGESGDSLLRRVDDAVYAAKKAGRDRVQAAVPRG